MENSADYNDHERRQKKTRHKQLCDQATFSFENERYMKTYALPRAELEVDVIDILWLLDYFGYFKRARNYQIQGSAETKVFEIGKHRS